MRFMLAAGRTLVCALGALAWAAPAWSDDAAPKKENTELFQQIDANSDGQVVADEVPAEHERLFKRLMRRGDANGDQQLSAEEFAAGLADKPQGTIALGVEPKGDKPRKAMTAAFGKLDRDGDGKVAADDVPEERRERFARWLERADRDDDQLLSREEFESLAMNDDGEGKPKRRPPREGQPGPPDGPRGEGGGPWGPPPSPVTRAIDADGDGEISAEELSAAGDALKKLDHNGDGRLDRSELGPPPPRPWRDGPRGDGPPGRPGRPRRGPEGASGEVPAPGDGPDGPPPDGQDWPPRMRRFEGRGPESPGGRRGDAPHPEHRGPKGPGPGGPGPDGPPGLGPEGRGRGPGDRGPGGAQMMERLFKADKDGDGKLSKEEAPERLQRVFEELDGNKDGLLEKEELHKHFEHMRHRLEGRRPEGRPRGGDRPRPDGPPGDGPRHKEGDKPPHDAEQDDDSSAAPEEPV